MRSSANNSIDSTFGREFAEATHLITASPQVRAVVLRAEGKNFCVGGDLSAIRQAGDTTHSYLRGLTTDLHGGLLNLSRGSALVIAAVNGNAAGAGLGLVLGADLAIASRNARFVAAYTAVGLSPDAGTSFHLPRAIGKKRASEMLLCNRMLDAPTALEWGLINSVVDDDKLTQEAFQWATRIANGAPGAFAATKRLIEDSMAALETQLEREGVAISECGATSEAREGMDAFMSKRSPKFQ